MKLIRNPIITNYLMQGSMLWEPTDITEFVAGYIIDRLKNESLFIPPLTMARADMGFHMELPYAITKRLFGNNFLGLLEGKGIDRSDMIKEFEDYIASNSKKPASDEWCPAYPWSVGLDLDVYYGDPCCFLAIKLTRVDVCTFICTDDSVLSQPRINIIAKIVNMGEPEK